MDDVAFETFLSKYRYDLAQEIYLLEKKYDLTYAWKGGLGRLDNYTHDHSIPCGYGLTKSLDKLQTSIRESHNFLAENLALVEAESLNAFAIVQEMIAKYKLIVDGF